MTRRLIGSFLMILTLGLAACGGPRTDDPVEDTPAGLANPASVHCEETGGTLEIRTDEEGGQVGVCLFDDGSECEEWAYYRGECAPGDQPHVLLPVAP